MKTTAFHPAPLPVLLATLVVLGAALAAVRAEDPEKPGKSDTPPSQAKPAPDTATKPGEKKDLGIAFAMRDKPWSTVLEWLCEQTGYSFVGNIIPKGPTGSFTFIGPKGKTYTAPEVIDILNEGLLQQKFVLIRRDRILKIMPADEKIDPMWLPSISVEELSEHGNTEIVRVVLTVPSLVAEDIAPKVKKMMGPFGEVVALTEGGANQLILVDTVGNLKRIRETIDPGKDAQRAESFSYQCQYIPARDAERVLKDLLGDPMRQPGMQPLLLPGQQPQGQQGRDQQGIRQMLAGPMPRIRMHYITSDERTNTVLVTGPADKIALAHDTVKRIDVPPPTGGQPLVIGASQELKTYNVPGNAEASGQGGAGRRGRQLRRSASPPPGRTPSSFMPIPRIISGLPRRSKAASTRRLPGPYPSP